MGLFDLWSQQTFKPKMDAKKEVERLQKLLDTIDKKFGTKGEVKYLNNCEMGSSIAVSGISSLYTVQINDLYFKVKSYKFSDDLLLFILAHEITHIKNSDGKVVSIKSLNRVFSYQMNTLVSHNIEYSADAGALEFISSLGWSNDRINKTIEEFSTFLNNAKDSDSHPGNKKRVELLKAGFKSVYIPKVNDLSEYIKLKNGRYLSKEYEISYKSINKPSKLEVELLEKYNIDALYRFRGKLLYIKDGEGFDTATGKNIDFAKIDFGYVRDGTGGFVQSSSGHNVKTGSGYSPLFEKGRQCR